MFNNDKNYYYYYYHINNELRPNYSIFVQVHEKNAHFVNVATTTQIREKKETMFNPSLACYHYSQQETSDFTLKL